VFDFSSGVFSIDIIQVFDPATVQGAEIFNYFFTTVTFFGLVAFSFGCIFNLIWSTLRD